jgi:hypothetical protein
VSGNDAPIACAAGRVDGGNGERWTFGHGMFRGDRVMLHTHDPDALLHIEMGMMVPHPPQPPTPAFPGRRRRSDPLPRLRRRTDAPPHDQQADAPSPFV